MKLYTMNAPPNPRKVDLLLKVKELDINDIDGWVLDRLSDMIEENKI